MNAPSPPAAVPQGDAVALEGTVERITFYNPENGFTVARVRTRGRREPVAVVGVLPAVQPGERLAMTGRWQTDPQHGAQFRPETAEARPPEALEDLVRYLGSGLIRQLGPVLARRIVDTFGEATLSVLDAEPGRVREVPGIGPRRAAALAAAWAEHRALRAVSAFLAEHGIDRRFAPRLVAAYGVEAPRTLAANPYRLVADVPGLGFAAADRLGKRLGVRPSAPARLQAAVHAALLRAAEQGHTRVAGDALQARAAELAGVESTLVGVAVTQLAAGDVITVGTGQASAAGAGGAGVQGEGVQKRADHPPQGPRSATPVAAEWADPAAGEEQGSVGRRVSAPAGTTSLWEWAASAPADPAAQRDPQAPPRASIREGRLKIYEPASTPIRATAPGQAAQEQNRGQGEEAADQSVPSDGVGLAGLVRAETALAAAVARLAARPSPLRPAAVDAWLATDTDAAALSDEQRGAVRAATLSGCFVLTGGPGVGKTTTVRVLVRCLEALGRAVALAAPTGKAAKRLGEVVGLEARTVHRLLGAGPRGFRHGPREPLPAEAVIVDEASMLDTQLARAVAAAVGPRAQLILVGDADQLPSVGPGQVLRDLLASGAVPSACLETVFRQAAQRLIVRNAHLIRRGEMPLLLPSSALARNADCVFVPVPGAGVAAAGAQWAARDLPRLLGVEPGEVQVLAPLTRVCQAVNALLQERLNPPRGQAERPFGALALRTGDRVIQTRNNYTLGVFNGDGGIVAAVDAEQVAVDFGDGRVLEYAPADLLDLEHAYCLTVHRAQGSEWPGVVILASSAHGPMLSRNLLYTALTRARRVAVIVGDEAAVRRAVAETRDLARSTGLARLLAAPAAVSQQ